ncbi:ORC complex protein Cdc6/Orc1 [Halogeometricum rufum]|uniref:ORC1-type DNA replication protein n=1 Tax=Halogeometricum rufum TaxID=553469 RepID=A0A1I6IJA7_9EURY|nr:MULTISPECIES: orc1/cdc6 family replication initiation protein [Halogeometricum]MUV57166.1 AAA family ATPase [Halogeometricum sp. CBA1124]SFR66380.1 ORC complex protein Cdc6/Orc1 [Halogeometricum rufum]
MTQPFSNMDNTLFEDKEVLSEDYQPDTILERDDEIRAYRDALKDVLFGRNPSNIFVYGKTGVGKTAVTNYMLQALEEETEKRDEADDLHVRIYNCNRGSVYGAVRTLVNKLQDDDEDPFPKTGLSTNIAFETLYEKMDDIGGTFLFVLDEIDHLSDADELLYEFPRARANGHITESKVGVIGISNNYRFRDSLSPKVRDTLMEKEISFSPYDANELRSILDKRAEKAFRDGACSESAIQLCAALAAQDTGGARQALDLLRTGGDLAESEGDGMVTDEHIQDAREQVRRGRVTNKIRDQTIHGQLVLESVARLESEDETPSRSKEIRNVYETVAGHYAYDPLTSLKSIQNHLGTLEMLGFLSKTEYNDGKRGGSYFVYELSVDTDAVFEAREQIERERE